MHVQALAQMVQFQNQLSLLEAERERERGLESLKDRERDEEVEGWRQGSLQLAEECKRERMERERGREDAMQAIKQRDEVLCAWMCMHTREFCRVLR